MKKYIIIFSSILFSLVIIGFISRENIIEHQLKKILSEKFKGFYQIKYSNIETEISLFNFSLQISNPVFTSDTTSSNPENFPILFFKGQKLSFTDFNIWSILIGKDIKMKSLNIDNPVLNLYIKNQQKSEKENKIKNIKQKGLEFISIDNININDAYVKQINIIDKKEIYSSTKLYLNIDDVTVNVNQINKPLKALNFNNFIISSELNDFKPEGGNYSYGIDSLYLNFKTKEFSAKNVSLMLNQNAETVSLKNNDQKIVPDLMIKKIYSNHINYSKFFFNDTLYVDTLMIQNTTVNLYQNKTTHKNYNIIKKELLKSLKEINYPITINDIIIDDSKLNFKLKVSDNKPLMNLDFDDLKVNIKDFSTYSFDTLKVNINSKFKEGDFNLKLKIPYQDTINYKQYFEGKLTNISFKSLSNIVESFAPVKLIDGKISLLYFNGVAKKNTSNGSVGMDYKDLKLEIINKKNHKAGVLSFIGNSTAIKHHSDKHEELKMKPFHVEKELWQDQTALIINGIVHGILNNVLTEPVKSIVK